MEQPQQLQVGNAARLLHGRYSPTYNISSINEEKQMATCVHYDAQKRKTIIEEIPLSVLTKYTEPKPPDLSDFISVFNR